MCKYLRNNIKVPLILSTIIFGLCIGIFSKDLIKNEVVEVKAATKVDENKKALKAYKNALTNSNSELRKNTLGADIEFALIDLNKDGVKEIVVTGDGHYHTRVCAYIKGRVKEIGSGFSGGQEYYPNKRIYYSVTAHGDAWEGYYKYNGKKMTLLAQKHITDIRYMDKEPEGTTTYTIKEKKVTKDKFKN